MSVLHVKRPRELQRWIGVLGSGDPELEAISRAEPADGARTLVGSAIASALDFDRPLQIAMLDPTSRRIDRRQCRHEDLRQSLSVFEFRRVAGAYALVPRAKAARRGLQLRRASGARRRLCGASPSLVEKYAPYPYARQHAL
jgi:hypothetical protein